MTGALRTLERPDPIGAVITTKVLRTRAEVEAIAPRWSDLAEASGQSALVLPSWALECFDTETAFRGARLRVVTAWAGDQLVGVGPFAELHERGLRVVVFLGLWRGQPNHIVLAPGYEEAGVHIWNALRTPRTYLRLDFLDEEVGLRTLLASDRWAVRTKEPSKCTVIDTSLEIERYLDTPARRRLRRMLNVAGRRTSADGIEMELRRAQGPEELAALVPLIGAIERTAQGDWHREGMHRELAAGRVPAPLAIAAREGRLIADVYVASGNPCAFMVALIGPGVVIPLIIGHDPAFRDYTPGHTSYLNLYRWAHEHGARPIDMSLGEQEYKQQWSNDGYGVVSVVAAPSRTTLAVTRAGGMVMDRVKGGLWKASALIRRAGRGH